MLTDVRATVKTVAAILLVETLSICGCSKRPEMLVQADDHPVKLSIDGSQVGTIDSNGFQKFGVSRGEHVVRAESLDGYYEWQEITNVETDAQKVIKLILSPSNNLLRAAYNRKFDVRVNRDTFLKDDYCFPLTDHIKITSGSLVEVSAPERIASCGRRNGVRVRYNGRVGALDSAELAFASK